jgi:hypothetical protein
MPVQYIRQRRNRRICRIVPRHLRELVAQRQAQLEFQIIVHAVMPFRCGLPKLTRDRIEHEIDVAASAESSHTGASADVSAGEQRGGTDRKTEARWCGRVSGHFFPICSPSLRWCSTASLAPKSSRGGFKKGTAKRGGRKPGMLNQATQRMRDIMEAAAAAVGRDGKGQDGALGYLISMAKRFPEVFGIEQSTAVIELEGVLKERALGQK